MKTIAILSLLCCTAHAVNVTVKTKQETVTGDILGHTMSNLSLTVWNPARTIGYTRDIPASDILTITTNATPAKVAAPTPAPVTWTPEQAAKLRTAQLTSRLAIVTQHVAAQKAKVDSLNEQLQRTPATTNIPIYEVTYRSPNKTRYGRPVSGMATESKELKGYRSQPNPSYLSLQSQLRSASNDLVSATSEQAELTAKLAK